MPELDGIIRASLEEFADQRLGAPWYAKEHNWVSLYAFAHLVMRSRRRTLPVHMTR